MEKLTHFANQQAAYTEDPSLTFSAIRAQGAGGQHVNKVATAIHLRFDIVSSSFPDELKQQLLTTADPAKTASGVIIIKVQATRSQQQNRNLARQKLIRILERMLYRPEERKATRIPGVARKKRLADKKKQAERKRLRNVLEYK